MNPGEFPLLEQQQHKQVSGSAGVASIPANLPHPTPLELEMRKEIELLKKKNAKLSAKILALEEGVPYNSCPQSNMKNPEDTVSECLASTSVSSPQTSTSARTLADHERLLPNIENQLQVMTQQLAHIPITIQQPLPKNMDSELHQRRLEAGIRALERRYGSNTGVYYMGVAGLGLRGYYTAAVIHKKTQVVYWYQGGKKSGPPPMEHFLVFHKFGKVLSKLLEQSGLSQLVNTDETSSKVAKGNSALGYAESVRQKVNRKNSNFYIQAYLTRSDISGFLKKNLKTDMLLVTSSTQVHADMTQNTYSKIDPAKAALLKLDDVEDILTDAVEGKDDVVWCGLRTPSLPRLLNFILTL
ncbi:hypothetical protein HPB51_025227 [Rhipicephalus microplus]|uniref:Uncharacterized protein n=1 Tax=Rhipicephalus microplus TaxID=6941 RepID=A0A9J6DDU3_RHIMP|nr:hypothetical protein HPB51_025227 [Rhipicephalus microplus]